MTCPTIRMACNLLSKMMSTAYSTTIRYDMIRNDLTSCVDVRETRGLRSHITNRGSNACACIRTSRRKAEEAIRKKGRRKDVEQRDIRR